MVAETTMGMVRHIHPDQIWPNPWELRRTVDAEGIRELADDIAANGLLQPILVRSAPDGDGYQRVFGQRRAMAVQLLIERGDWTGGIPAQVIEMTDAEMALSAISENSAREAVDPIEEIRGLKRILDEIDGVKQTDLAERLGVSKGQLSNRLGLLRLPNEALALVSDGILTWTSLREMRCLVGSDHRHDLEIAHVVETLRTKSNGRKTAGDVRDAIVTATYYRKDAWRVLEYEKTRKWWSGGCSEEPAFDVRAFEERHAEYLHTLPLYEGTGGALWTCRGKAWTAEQNRALEALREAEPEPEAPEPTNDWAVAMAKDKVVQRVAPEFTAENPTLTDEQVEALGTRALAGRRLVTPYNQEWIEEIEDGGRSDPPPHLFDRRECLESCTGGAVVLGSNWAELACINQGCYGHKKSEGLERFRGIVRVNAEMDDARHKRLSQAIEEAMNPDAPIMPALMMALLAATPPRPVQPTGNLGYAWRDTELNSYPAAVCRVAACLDTALPAPASVDAMRAKWFSEGETLPRDLPPSAYADVIALAIDKIIGPAKADELAVYLRRDAVCPRCGCHAAECGGAPGLGLDSRECAHINADGGFCCNDDDVAVAPPELEAAMGGSP